MIAHPGDERGFTIAEILVALVLSSVLMLFIYKIFDNQNRLQVDENQKMTLQQDGRAALNILSNGMRQAGYFPMGVEATEALNGSTSGSGMTTAALRGVTFVCDFNENGQNDSGETISYRLNSGTPTTLERITGGVTDVLLTNVAAFAILYAWDRDGPGASSGYGDLEPSGAGTQWCHDSTGDGVLDTCYLAGADGQMAFTTPDTTTASIPFEQIRGVRLWLLLRSGRQKLLDVPQDLVFNIPGLDTSTLDSDYRYRSFASTVKLRNMYF
ncbi:PilW family protein [Desulfoluna sp.]|uniref:PilW family protein n=1 Tax=Desulfoluna sp. TaxID=2045199 RepID=UPI0026106BA0|nr:prepilin-type N-terminal cleavage/methylation domain-containing protein [Desulfoluna sp.]